MSRGLSFLWFDRSPLRWLRQAWRRTRPSPDELAFAARSLAALEQARRWYDDWRFQVQLSSDYPVLANLAAVRRWELARLAHDLSTADPPPLLKRHASDTIRVLAMNARSFQQLTAGYRFQKFERVCEGQALLEEARALREQVAARWKRVYRNRS